MPVADWFVEAFGGVIADIRQKLVEEPWFGRPLEPKPEHGSPSLEEAFAWSDSPAAETLDLAAEDIDHDLGIEP